MPRLFTAIDIPDDVADALSALRGGLPGARWIEPENYHITLRFAGDVDEVIADDFADALGRISRPAFRVEFEGLGVFGGDKPRSVFARIRLTPEITALQKDHERAARTAGLSAESRKFVPHVTLARLRSSGTLDVADYLMTRGGFYGHSFLADSFVLLSSRDSVGGGPYVQEATYPLIRGSFGERRPASNQ